MQKEYFVYLLSSTTKNRTYVGYTCNIKRRLRQHNGEITGGAKATRNGRPWKMICYVKGFPDNVTGLQFEWRLHHPLKHLKYRRGKSGVEWRINVMNETLKMEKI